ncbi:hypothetical protein CAEBREN_13189 [Caenorhabditis brenneri]|uniref:MICOS complex subunit MIC60 n=1 Tax=Caenorhabditis brenneri TaxID=135651 RepID=G0N1C4_CAEBE|nr:hypothetical protein CAEBREN_13189 [Caenorhabditis brenneri]
MHVQKKNPTVEDVDEKKKKQQTSETRRDSSNRWIVQRQCTHWIFLKTLLSCGGNTDEFVKTIDNSMAKTSKVVGEYTEEDLNTRFNKVCRIGRRVAYVKEGGALAHLYSWLKSSLTIELTPKDTSLTPSIENNFTLLTRAEQLWKSGKKGDAIRVLQMTDGATRRVAADFIQDARRQQEALLLSRLLLAHAALTSIRSTY